MPLGGGGGRVSCSAPLACALQPVRGSPACCGPCTHGIYPESVQGPAPWKAQGLPRQRQGGGLAEPPLLLLRWGGLNMTPIHNGGSPKKRRNLSQGHAE